jgi:SAM-dependent methyltransferase
MLAEAERKIRDGRLDGVTAGHFDLATDAPPPGAPFDLVVSLLLLHHVKDTRAALAGCIGCSRPAGSRGHRPGHRGRLVPLADAEGVHHHGFDRRSLAELARDAGFTDVRVGDGHPIDDEGGATHVPAHRATG